MLAICLQIFLKKITNFTFMYFGYLLKVKHLIWFISQNSSEVYGHTYETEQMISPVWLSRISTTILESSIIQLSHFTAKTLRPKEVKQFDHGYKHIFPQEIKLEAQFPDNVLFALIPPSLWESFLSKETQVWKSS